MSLQFVFFNSKRQCYLTFWHLHVINFFLSRNLSSSDLIKHKKRYLIFIYDSGQMYKWCICTRKQAYVFSQIWYKPLFVKFKCKMRKWVTHIYTHIYNSSYFAAVLCLNAINLITLGFFFAIILRHTEWWSIRNSSYTDRSLKAFPLINHTKLNGTKLGECSAMQICWKNPDAYSPYNDFSFKSVKNWILAQFSKTIKLADAHWNRPRLIICISK